MTPQEEKALAKHWYRQGVMDTVKDVNPDGIDNDVVELINQFNSEFIKYGTDPDEDETQYNRGVRIGKSVAYLNVINILKAGYAASPQSSSENRNTSIKENLDSICDWLEDKSKDKPAGERYSFAETANFIYDYVEYLFNKAPQSSTSVRTVDDIIHCTCITLGIDDKECPVCYPKSTPEEEKDLWAETISFFLEACAANVGDNIHEKVVAELQSKFKISKR